MWNAVGYESRQLPLSATARRLSRRVEGEVKLVVISGHRPLKARPGFLTWKRIRSSGAQIGATRSSRVTSPILDPCFRANVHITVTRGVAAAFRAGCPGCVHRSSSAATTPICLQPGLDLSAPGRATPRPPAWCRCVPELPGAGVAPGYARSPEVTPADAGGSQRYTAGSESQPSRLMPFTICRCLLHCRASHSGRRRGRGSWIAAFQARTTTSLAGMPPQHQALGRVHCGVGGSPAFIRRTSQADGRLQCLG